MAFTHNTTIENNTPINERERVTLYDSAVFDARALPAKCSVLKDYVNPWKEKALGVPDFNEWFDPDGEGFPYYTATSVIVYEHKMKRALEALVEDVVGNDFVDIVYDFVEAQFKDHVDHAMENHTPALVRQYLRTIVEEFNIYKDGEVSPGLVVQRAILTNKINQAIYDLYKCEELTDYAGYYLFMNDEQEYEDEIDKRIAQYECGEYLKDGNALARWKEQNELA